MSQLEHLENRRLLSASLAGSVFSDDNGDGVHQASEAGIAGQQAYLDLQGIGSFKAGDPTSTTDVNGNYSFPNLAAGNYIVRLQTVPTGHTQTNPLLMWGGFYYIPLADGQAITGKDFGEHPDSVITQNSGSIAGNIFSDGNSNGIKDATESALTGQQVYLDLQGLGYFVNTDPVATSDASGNYLFSNLPAANYLVRLLNVPATEQITTPIPTYGGYFYIPMATASNITGKDFGLHVNSVATIPVAPGNLVLAISNNTSVSISFTDNSPDETGFLIERATAAAGPWTAITTAPPSPSVGSTVTFTDTTAAAASTYFYRVSAVNSAGNSAPTPAASITTNPAPVPTAPTNVRLSVTNDAPVIVSFTDTTAAETGFIISRATASAGPWTTVATLAAATGSGSVVSYSDSTTLPSTTYYYQVTATGSSANASPTAPVSITTGAKMINAGLATLSGNVFNDLNSDGVQNPGETGVLGQQIYLDLQGLGYFVNSDPIATSDAAGNYQFANLAAGNYIARLMNVPANETLTAPIPNYGGFFWVPLAAGQNAVGKNFGLHLPPTLPAAPDGLVLAVTNDAPVTITFADNSNNETGFLIERSTSSTGPFAALATASAAAGTGSIVTYSDSTTLPSTTYFYRVSAVNALGNSAPTATSSIKTGVQALPAAPSNLLLQVPTDIPVTISFTDNSTNETGFIIQRGTNVNGPFATVTTLTASPAAGAIVSYVDTTTVASTTYYYRVEATGAIGNSPFTAVSNITTKSAAAPVPLLAGSWNLKFNENFDTVDSNIWSSRYWWNGNSGTQATFSPSQVTTNNGVLSITALQQNATAANGVTNPYLSGMISTGGIQGKQAPGFTFTYGYVEARSKIAAGWGMWSALWLLPADYNDNYELDMFENLGRAPTTAQSFYHYGPALADGSFTPTTDLTAAFHTYGLDWEPDHITWYFDGVAVHSFTSPAAIVNRPMYLILNLDVGGQWAGPLNSSSPASATWQIDYLRVWQH